MQARTHSPGCHQRNVAEVGIKSFKSHFIAILAGLPDSFPLRLWCKLVPQAELTLNILRPSHARPMVSAHTYVHGAFNFDQTPLAPIGCELQCHEKANNMGNLDRALSGRLVSELVPQALQSFSSICQSNSRESTFKTLWYSFTST